MKRNILSAICIICLLSTSCHHKKDKDAVQETVELNEQDITTFAKNIALGIVNGDAKALNDVIDKQNIKEVVTENSIVYSGFDVAGADNYFNRCLQLGDVAVQAVNNGGDYAFTKYYVKDKQHHIVFRTYDNFNINFMDFIVDTLDGKLIIKDGFLYDYGCNLSKSIESSMLYNLMLQTNPESDVKYLKEIESLSKNKENAKALALQKKHKESLKDYILYKQLYVANLYANDKKLFTTHLASLKDEGYDERYLLLHQLLYEYNEGNIAETEKTINALIEFTGDDPVFLMLYGYANLYAEQYEDALTCFNTAAEAMPLLWDLWQGQLKCYKQLNDTAGYNECLQKGKKAFGLSDHELAECQN